MFKKIMILFPLTFSGSIFAIAIKNIFLFFIILNITSVNAAVMIGSQNGIGTFCGETTGIVINEPEIITGKSKMYSRVALSTNSSCLDNKNIVITIPDNVTIKKGDKVKLNISTYHTKITKEEENIIEFKRTIILENIIHLKS